MDELYFNGIWRMDWGLGNPNKTAALIAILMVAVWGLAYVRKWGFWVAITLFMALGGCLVHTFSRGGLIAAGLGLAVLLAYVPRPWPKKRGLALGFSVLGLIVFSFCLNAHERYGQGVIEEDRSIINRAELWKSAPKMMVDAPTGWGLGNSGKAFMQWYQWVPRNEQYRTMVNSHLTWLVESGWPARFLYLFAWGGCLSALFADKQIPLACRAVGYLAGLWRGVIFQFRGRIALALARSGSVVGGGDPLSFLDPAMAPAFKLDFSVDSGGTCLCEFFCGRSGGG